MTVILDLLAALVFWAVLVSLVAGGILLATAGWFAWQDRRDQRRLDGDPLAGAPCAQVLQLPRRARR